MGAFELNDGLRPFMRRKGQPALNQAGKTNVQLRARFREFRDELYHIGLEFCDDKRHRHKEPITRIQCLARRLWNTTDERWAVRVVLERMLGKVPLELELTPRLDYREALDEASRQRYRELVFRERDQTLTPEEAIELRQFRGLTELPQLPPIDLGPTNG